MYGLKQRNLTASIMILGMLIMFTFITGCVDDEEEAVDEENLLEEEVEDISQKFGNELVGIDPGAGMMETASDVLIPEYGLDDYELIESSEPAMIAALERAVGRDEWIAVLGWTPHWKWAEMDLKFLDDPKQIYGEAEDIRALSRLGFENDFPEVKKLIDNFYINDEQLGSLMKLVEKKGDDMEAAVQWAEDNQDLINEWIPGDADGNGEEIKLLYNNWVCARAKTNLVTHILRDKMNYQVNKQMVEVGPLYQTLSDGEGDLMVHAWLPLTQANYWEEYGDRLVDHGPIYEGGKIGVVVPDYVDIDCITEMQ
ncbi:glycine betaine ABC transporter substrate-binding protein [Natranaerobius trueperi]|uniref:Glycine/betaine ABC transporter n=1 Tax=Natranaerobius trueperi TaxID=759412 RepID=A0A226BV35_9FIRM|nr:glycine betaine ABC transporter substrate-binding protein [Natranaerobius trueperi]OWZ82853.1 glycine/betaine ABC transporter [Natranaerobius trueperi]